MANKNILICVDRDGTLIYDNRYYLGRTNDWKSKIKFMKNSIKGIKLLNKKIPNAPIFIITNQPGLAIQDFPLLTFKRYKLVEKTLLNMIKAKGAKLAGCIFCPYASPKYIISHSQYTFRKKFIKDSNYMKPKPGMILEALKRSGFKKSNTQIFFIGDRASDMEAALNVNGTGILIPFSRTPTEKEKVEKLSNKNTFVAKDFLDAAKFIIRKFNY